MSTDTKSKLYKTETVLERRLRVACPPGNGQMVLRTDYDWDKDISPIETSADGKKIVARAPNQRVSYRQLVCVSQLRAAA